MIFIHGLTAQHSQVISLLGKLNGYQLICPDCPGHGKSVLTPSQKVTFDAFTDTLVEWMDYLGIEKAIVGGISMGAGISLNMACRYPSRVRALILLRPAWLDRPDPPHLRLLMPAARLTCEAGGEEVFKKNVAWNHINTELPLAAESILNIFQTSQQKDLARVIAGMLSSSPIQTLMDLKKMNVPSMVVGNDDDPLHPWSVAEKIQEYLSNSKLHKVVSRYVDDLRHTKDVRNLVSGFLQSNNMADLDD